MHPVYYATCQVGFQKSVAVLWSFALNGQARRGVVLIFQTMTCSECLAFLVSAYRGTMHSRQTHGSGFAKQKMACQSCLFSRQS